MLTKQDITKLRGIFATKQDLERLVSRLEFNERMEDFELKIKDIVLTSQSIVMGELKAMREEHTINTFRMRNHSDQLNNHENRLVGLEAKLS